MLFLGARKAFICEKTFHPEENLYFSWKPFILREICFPWSGKASFWENLISGANTTILRKPIFSSRAKASFWGKPYFWRETFFLRQPLFLMQKVHCGEIRYLTFNPEENPYPAYEVFPGHRCIPKGRKWYPQIHLLPKSYTVLRLGGIPCAQCCK